MLDLHTLSIEQNNTLLVDSFNCTQFLHQVLSYFLSQYLKYASRFGHQYIATLCNVHYVCLFVSHLTSNILCGDRHTELPRHKILVLLYFHIILIVTWYFIHLGCLAFFLRLLTFLPCWCFYALWPVLIFAKVVLEILLPKPCTTYIYRAAKPNVDNVS